MMHACMCVELYLAYTSTCFLHWNLAVAQLQRSDFKIGGTISECEHFIGARDLDTPLSAPILRLKADSSRFYPLDSKDPYSCTTLSCYYD